MRRTGARFELAGQRAVQRGQRNRHLGEVQAGQFRPQVDVADDQRRLGDDADRVARFEQHLEHRAGQLGLTLEGLVGIGRGAERDGRAGVARLAQFFAQQAGGIGFGEYLRFEIQPRRQAQISVGRPGVAVDAAVLAAPVRIQRLIKAEIRRIVAADDTFCTVDQQARLRQGGFRWLPAIGLGLAGVCAEAIRDIARRAPSLEGLRGNFRRGSRVEVFHGHPVECTVSSNF